MRAAAAFALVLLAGCGDEGPVGNGKGPSEDEIRRLSTPEVEVIDPQRPVRPQPLKVADLAPMPAPVCAFGRGGKMLLAASEREAIARIRGRLRHLAHRAPLGPSGGFFADGRISISVGRLGGTSGDTGAWPARITITNRRAGAQMEIEGVWRCDGHAETVDE
jgi:hypothetical protein